MERKANKIKISKNERQSNAYKMKDISAEEFLFKLQTELTPNKDSLLNILDSYKGALTEVTC